MKNEQIKELTLALLRADDESTVIEILEKHGLWDNAPAWRLYGDRDGNYATIGNQQGKPESALVEKIVNSVDARILGECLVNKIDPESAEAPNSVSAAVNTFFEEKKRGNDAKSGGKLQDWTLKLIQEQEQYITLAATGSKPPNSPCLTLVDQGEGQTPDRLPDTFMSIDRSNKLRIRFVQGKFNMGGTGALKFCGKQGLQLLISRRNPAILDSWKGNARWGSSDPRASHWAVTIVRRERPKEEAGEVRNSVYKYLAPEGSMQKPGKGQVLSFESESLPLMPEQNQAYVREIKFGTAIKLYEYDVKGFGSHVLQPDGLLGRTELLLPEIALPVRMHECRAYKGDPNRSFANTLKGIVPRLQDNKNLEVGYPSSVPITVRNEKMTAHIYAFQGGKADTYRKNEGVIFTINGQTHGYLPKSIFNRNKVKMPRLADSVIVIVDCSGLSVGAREDLFMNSRDRLTNGELRKAVEAELEDVIGHHPGLRELRERRRNEEISERLADSKPLENVLASILKSSPTLSKLFLFGQRLSQPHRADQSSTNKGGGQGGDRGAGKFVGKAEPTYFRFFGGRDGIVLDRHAELGRRCRIKFETDAENGYFERTDYPGRYHVEVIEGPLEGFQVEYNLIPFDGVANWSISLPEERMSVGDSLTLEFTVTDDSLIEPFVNVARIQITEPKKDGSPSKKQKQKTGGGQAAENGSGASGSGGDGIKDGISSQGGIEIPQIIEVHHGDHHWTEYHFDESTACHVIDDGTDDGKSRFTFYVNVDNLYLKTEMKGSESDVALTKKKFIWGNVLVGLALIHDNQGRKKKVTNEDENESVQEIASNERIESTTRALAPFLVPMIDYLGALTDEDVLGLAQRGDEE